MGFEISWSSEFETGIDIIDQQHRRLFDYFAEIEAAIAAEASEQVSLIVRGLIDYAISHNTFEESLMEKAGYAMLAAHRQVHEAFRERANNYAVRLDQGADPMRVARELRVDIGLWLINHIKREDQHYVPCVKKSLDHGFVSRMLGKFFG